MTERSGIEQPFYWVAPSAEGCYVAPTGWYRWTKRGLEYIGPTILEPVEYPHQEGE